MGMLEGKRARNRAGRGKGIFKLFKGVAVVGALMLTGSAIFFKSVEAQEAVGAGIIFSNPVESVSSPIHQIDFDTADWLTRVLERPAFWGIELTGADLAKEDIASLNLSPVVAVVSDGGVREGAIRQLNANAPKRIRRTIDLGLLAHTGLGIIAPGLNKRTEVKRLFAQLPKFPAASEFIYSPTHPTHGEHVAGLIGAENQAYGVSPVAQIEDLDVFQGEQPAREEVLIQSYRYLLNRPEPTPVLNMSHGISPLPEILEPLRELVEKRDTICVLAAHNQGIRIANNAAAAILSDECIVVGAYGLTGTRTHFSNYGSAVDIVAPGEEILSRGKGWPYKSTEIEMMSGTSMATPIVSGAMTILRALLPNAKASSLRTILYRSAIDLGLPGRDEFTGYGLVNIVKAESVARRLAQTKKTSAKDVERAVQNPKTYEFSQEVFALKARRLKNFLLGLEFDEKAYRKELLLDGSPSALFNLGTYYINKGFNVFGIGLQFAALNRPTNLISKEHMKTFALVVAELQKSRNLIDPRDWSLFQSLANKDLIIDVYDSLTFDEAMQTTSFFARALARLETNSDQVLAELLMKKLDHSKLEPLVAKR